MAKTGQGEIGLISAILDQWVTDSRHDTAMLLTARANPSEYWFLMVISGVTRLEPEQVIDVLIDRVEKKKARQLALKPRVLDPVKEKNRRIKAGKGLKKTWAERRPEMLEKKRAALAS